MKKLFSIAIMLMAAYSALYSQCFNIDTTSVPFTNKVGGVGFYIDGTHPSFMRTRYIEELSLTGNSFTIKFRMKIISVGTPMYCFGKSKQISATDYGWYISYAMDYTDVQFYADNVGLIPIYYDLEDTNYHNYELYYDANTESLTSVVDGDTVFSGYSMSSQINSPDTNTVFCAGHKGAPNKFGSMESSYLPGPSDYFFRGYFDYIKIETPSNLFHWSFDEGAGEVAHDSLTYKIWEVGQPGGGLPETNHLMNGCTWNYDWYNATWYSDSEPATPFSSVGYGFKKWQLGSQTWEPSRVTGMTVWQSGLVATGVFTKINASDIYTNNGDSAKNIAYYNPMESSSWMALDKGLFGPGGTNDIGECVTVYDNKLIAVGAFLTAGVNHDTVNNIAQLDSIDGNWRELYGGFSGTDLNGTFTIDKNGDTIWGYRSCIGWTAKVYNGELYAGGTFWNAGDKRCNYVARWNDSVWNDLDSGTNWDVVAMEVYDSVLYFGGGFTKAGNPRDDYHFIAIWDGSSLQYVEDNGSEGANQWVTAMCVYNGELYVAGAFTLMCGVSCNGLVKFDGSDWYAVGTGPSGLGHGITAMTVFDGDLYLTGSFYYMNGVPCYDICKYNENDGFCAISNGLEQAGLSLTVFNNELYVGGKFYSADGHYYSNILKYSDNNDYRVLSKNIQPQLYVLNQNYPNPFNPKTTIKFIIPKTAKVTSKIYDLIGREVETIFNNTELNAGTIVYDFDGTDFASGVYFYTLIVNDELIATKKMVLLK